MQWSPAMSVPSGNQPIFHARQPERRRNRVPFPTPRWQLLQSNDSNDSNGSNNSNDSSGSNA